MLRKNFIVLFKTMKFKSIVVFLNICFMRFNLIFLLVAISTTLSCSNDDEKEEITLSYSLTYVANEITGGNVPVDETSYEANTIANVANQGSLIKEGYSFTGWNTAVDGSGTNYESGAVININDSDIILYAQWLNNIVHHELVTENVLDILNVPVIPENDWYYASVDFENGTLETNVENSDLMFQFHYKGGGDNYGFLRVSQGFYFHTTDDANMVLDLEEGIVIDESLFGFINTSEISGNFQNWDDKADVFIPVYITVDGEGHYGYINVSYNDMEGLLTIHALAYNRLPGEPITTGDDGIN